MERRRKAKKAGKEEALEAMAMMNLTTVSLMRGTIM
jgi:hypothetical protein